MSRDPAPPGPQPGQVEEYLAGMRANLALLLGVAERLGATGNDRAALAELLRETQKIQGAAGSFGFLDASRLAAGMEATVRDWASHPDDQEVDRGSLTLWFVTRLAALLKLEMPRRAAAPRPKPTGAPALRRTAGIATPPSAPDAPGPPRVSAPPPAPPRRLIIRRPSAVRPSPEPPAPIPTPAPAPPAAAPPARAQARSAPPAAPSPAPQRIDKTEELIWPIPPDEAAGSAAVVESLSAPSAAPPKSQLGDVAAPVEPPAPPQAPPTPEPQPVLAAPSVEPPPEAPRTAAPPTPAPQPVLAAPPVEPPAPEAPPAAAPPTPKPQPILAAPPVESPAPEPPAVAPLPTPAPQPILAAPPVEPPPPPAPEASPAAAPTPEPQPIRESNAEPQPIEVTATVAEVIFVEDDAALAELLEYGLQSRAYRFLSYRNGREALRELLALDVQGTRPLLLLDVDLPGLDGYSVFDALQRERPGTYRVVFTTVHGTEEEQLRGLEAGALDYMVKPISLRVALEKIKRWVGR